MKMQFVKDHAALAVLIAAFVALAYFNSGCAFAMTQCDYIPAAVVDGKPAKTLLEESVGWSAVLGKGKIDNTVIVCKSIFHDSVDTGIDDNAALIGAAIADAVSKATPAGALGGVISDGIDAVDDDELLIEKLLPDGAPDTE